MTVVLDSNVAVALAIDAERAPVVKNDSAPGRRRKWLCMRLTRNVAAGKIDFADAKVAWQRIVAIEISLHGLTDGPAVIAVARKLKRESAYDAAYIALAQVLDAELWTLDGPLSRKRRRCRFAGTTHRSELTSKGARQTVDLAGGFVRRCR